MISAAHMLGAMLRSEKIRKNVQFGASWCIFGSDFAFNFLSDFFV